MKKQSKILGLMIAVIMLSSIFGGCADQGTTTPPSTTDATSKYGGTLVFGSSGDAARLDPADVTDGESIQRMDNIHEGLVMYEEGTTSIKPALATEWTISEDKKTITFKLRKGVKFHKNFGEMTADDVVFSFARQYDPNNWYHDKGEWAYWGYMFSDIESVEKIDDYTVAIHMSKPNSSMMTSLAMFTAAIVSEKAAKQYGDDYFKNPVGTGPFEFVEWVKDDHITLKAFPDYWGGKAYLDQLIFKVIPDPSARLMALQAGEIDGMEYPDPAQLEIIKNDPKLQLVSQAGMNIGYIALNCGEGYVDKNGNYQWDDGEEVAVPGAFEPFKDIRVRQAIAYAINKEAIVKNLYKGAASVATQGMPPGLLGYNDQLTGYPYDPEKAKQLLKDAGYENGFKVTLWHMGSTSRPYFPEPTGIAEAIQSDLAKVGIQVELFTEDWGTYLQDAEAGKAQMIMLGWSGDNGDPDNFLNVLYSDHVCTVGSAGNYGFKKNPPLQKVLNNALLTYDQTQRDTLYRLANKMIVDEGTHVFVAHADQNLAFKSNVKGFVIHPTDRKFFYPVYKEK
jgi:peptide/nickel transport system substrate-binding protein